MKKSLLSGGLIDRIGCGESILSPRTNYGCGSRRATSVWSFGDNSNGALGISSPLLDAYEPEKIPALPATITSVAAGHYHSVAVNADGEVWAWGRNEEGQLGRGADAPRYTWGKPERVLGLNNVKVQAAYASGVVSAAVGDDGSLWVWGRSKRGQLGLGKGITEAIKPTKVKALLGEEISKVSFGWGHAFALTRDGKLFGWGYAENGRLGKMGEALSSSNSQYPSFSSDNSVPGLEVSDNLVTEKSTEKVMPINWEPSVISELSSIEVSDVACGLDHSLILCRDGNVLSCGDNTYGQLGRETGGLEVHPVPVNFHPISLSAGLGHSLLLYQIPSKEGYDLEEAATGILSWGWNGSSQLGRKGQENVPAPVEGLEGEALVSVSAGRVHSLCLTSKGRRVWTWGSGRNGRLGLGSSADETEPTSVQCMEGFEVVQAVAGFDHNLLLVAD